MMKSTFILCMGFILYAGTCAGEDNAGFRQIVAANFSRWDGNHDGKLSMGEIDALIENPQVKGDEAAAIVVIRNVLSNKRHPDPSIALTRDQLLGCAEEPSVENNFSWDKEEIQSCNHALFLPGDPNLQTVQQGRVGDCYLLAVVGTLVNSDPQAVRRMITPLPNNLFKVDFPDGTNVVVSNVTDAELLQGAKVGENHGVWLDILEKAFALRRERNRKAPDDASPEAPAVEVPRDFLGGGRTPPTMQRLTGHKIVSLFLDRANGNDPQPTARKIHKLLIQLIRERRLITTGSLVTDKRLPPRLVRGHCWAIVGYNSKTRLVAIFNPWGNEFTPAGKPGLANGYAVHHGVFNMPLQEYIQVFRKLNYETDEPLNPPVGQGAKT